MLRQSLFKAVSSGRRLCSTLKDARAARKSKLESATAAHAARSPGSLGAKLGGTAFLGAVAYSIYEIGENPEGALGSIYHKSPVAAFLKGLAHRTDDIFQPSSDKLLPDWPTAPCYGNIPPGTPAPPLLVVDLERTLIGSVHDAHHGWRHVKRPGLDTFINALSQYYEIVIFSENDVGVVQDVLMAIDKEGRTHKLGANAGEVRGTQVLKRLDHMNRDVSRIILIDDDPNSSQLFPRNTLQVPPFDPNDKGDTMLLELIPLLQAFVHEEAKDFRDTIDNLGTHDAKEAATEYRMRLARKKHDEEVRRNCGIGGLIRGGKPVTEDDGFNIPSAIPSAMQLVGEAPKEVESAVVPLAQRLDTKVPGVSKRPDGPAEKKKGKLFAWLDESDKLKEEEDRVRREKMNEIYAGRMRAKQESQESQEQ